MPRQGRSHERPPLRYVLITRTPMEQPVALPRRPFRTRPHGLVALLVLAVSATAMVPSTQVALAAEVEAVSISGVLTDAAGAPASGVFIDAYRPDGPADSRGTYVAQDRAAADGSFRIDGLTAGVGYRLFVNWSTCCSNSSVARSHPAFLTDDPSDPMSQNPMAAALFTPGDAGLDGLRLQLEPSAEVSGRIISQSGTPIEGVELYPYAKTTWYDLITEPYPLIGPTTRTAADGTFRLRDLELIGDDVEGWVLHVRPTVGRGGYLSRETSVGLVPVDQARVLQLQAEGISGLDVVLPEVRLPADQIQLGPPISPTDRWGQVIAVGSGTLSAFSLETPGGSLDAGVPIRAGFDDERVYLPGDWGGVALDWLENINPDWSHFQEYDDVVSVDERGDMHLYEGNGHGALREPRKIGQGWNGYRVIPAGDLTGEGHPDLLASDPKGDLKLYRSNGKGGFLWPYPQVGRGWIGYDLYAAGDLTQDGRTDILSVDSRGDLYMYAGNGNGTFNGRVKVGRGWGTYTLASGADLDGYYVEGVGYVNGAADIVGRDDATGDLYLYSGQGDGRFPTKRLIATGW
jgi:hypothetical protein